MALPRTTAVRPSALLGPWIERALEVGGGIVPALRALGAEMPPARRPAWRELCETLAAGDTARAGRALDRDPDTWIPLLAAAAPGTTTGDGRSEEAFLRRAVDAAVRGADDERWWLPVVYPLLVLSVAAGVVGFLTTFLVPQFRRIFDDFGTELPGMTRLLLSAHTFLSGWGGGATLLVAALGGAWLVRSGALAHWTRGIAGRWARSGRFARQVAALLVAGVPQEAAEAVARAAADPRGGRVAVDGRPRWLTATVRQALDGAPTAAGRARILERVAVCHDERLLAQRSWTAWILGPFAVAVTGVAVFLMAVALFMPLVKLLYDLS